MRLRGVRVVVIAVDVVVAFSVLRLVASFSLDGLLWVWFFRGTMTWAVGGERVELWLLRCNMSNGSQLLAVTIAIFKYHMSGK